MGRRSSASLTPATGARTTRLCRTQPRQSSTRCVRSRTKARPANTTTRPTLPRPPRPVPTFVTMANAPLSRLQLNAVALGSSSAAATGQTGSIKLRCETSLRSSLRTWEGRMEWKKHCYRVGSHTFEADDLPTDASELDLLVGNARKQIEPWLSAVFQAEHLNVVLGSGFTTAIALKAGGGATGMSKVKFGSKFDAQIDLHATASAKAMGRGEPNIEDQFRSALAVYEGLLVIDAAAAAALKDKLDQELSKFLKSLLATEKQIAAAASPEAQVAANTLLQSFLLSCASRAASRERLHIFTTNYDRLIEHGSDLAGLRIIDRFVGALSPLFRSSRVEVDVHYNPPGISCLPKL